MGERFERARPQRPLAWTGERLTTEASGQVEVEHLHRYFLARHFARGLDVLDIAAGEGYGSDFLAQTARSVIGVDIDADTVEHAARAYVRDNLRFMCGRAEAIPVPDRSVDLVVSFETIEHLREQEAFLREIKRVLRPAGRLIMSSPDREHYALGRSEPNPHHVRELAKAEFEQLLRASFKFVALAGQRPIVGSLLVSDPPAAQGGSPLTFERRAEDSFEASAGVDRPLYNVAVASDEPVPIPPESFYFERGSVDDATVTAPALRAQVADRDRQLNDQRERFEQQERALEDREHELGRLRSELVDLRVANRVAERQRARLEEHLTRVEQHLARVVPKLEQVEERLSRIRRSSLYWLLWIVVKVESELRRFGRRISGRQTRRPTPRAVSTITSPPVAPAPRDIRLPSTAPRPDVSVLILSHGHVDHTLACLGSIAKAPPDCAVEIVVSDDCSGAPDLHRLREVEGLRLLQTPENLGFVLHANWAVPQTGGAYVLLLNNDTELQPGAIDSLFETAEQTPNLGLVGSKLVYPRGALQEAGGIVWSDASAWNYGRNDDPDRPEYNYLRDVDYVSGASILFPRQAWDLLGGFDPGFAPAYCEDSDFAFRLRERGLRVLYQPSSVVIHHEGVSHGTDLAAGVKAHQALNQARLRERWSPTLQADHWRNGEHVLRARDRARNRSVALVIDHYAPQPDRDAGSRTMLAFVRALQADGYVVKFWPENLHYHPIYTRQLQQMGVETFYAPWVTSFDDWLAENGRELDLVLLSRPTVAQRFLPTIAEFAPAARTAFYGHDLHGERLRIAARRTDDPALAREAEAMEAQERAIWRQVDLVLYPSQEEADRVLALEPGVPARAVLPYCFERFEALGDPPGEPGMIFVAGFAHGPNVDAARWLVDEILPRVRKRLPNVRLSLVGSNPTDDVKALAGDAVRVTGFVSDQALAERYRGARLAVVPLRIGAGVKLKVVEAMQMARPVVTTSIGAQGLPSLAEIAAVADEPEALADACVRLLQDDAAWRAQAARQTDYVRERFSVEALRASFSAAMASVRSGRRAMR